MDGWDRTSSPLQSPHLCVLDVLLGHDVVHGAVDVDTVEGLEHDHVAIVAFELDEGHAAAFVFDPIILDVGEGAEHVPGGLVPRGILGIGEIEAEEGSKGILRIARDDDGDMVMLKSFDGVDIDCAMDYVMSEQHVKNAEVRRLREERNVLSTPPSPFSPLPLPPQ